jgi:hypothetical protein
MLDIGGAYKDGNNNEVEVVSGPNRMGHYYCIHKDVLLNKTELNFETGESRGRKRKLYDALVIHDQDGAAVGAGEDFDIGLAGRIAKGKVRG